MSDRPATIGVAGFWKETEMRRMKSLLLKGLRHKFWKGKMVCIKERFSPIQGCKKLVDFVRSTYMFP